MALKDQILSDLSVFFNEDDFADQHNINGQSKVVIVDNDRLNWRRGKDFDGNIVGSLLYYIQVSDYPGSKKPKTGDAQSFDGKPFTIFDVGEDEGMYEIILDRDGS